MISYQTEFTSPASSTITESGTTRISDSAHLHQFVMHSALDVVEEKMWETTNKYLKTLDNFNNKKVYAWVTASGAKFLLLHEQKAEDGARGRIPHKNEESIKLLFSDVNDLYSKTVLNPFYNPDEPIRPRVFQERGHTLGLKLL